MHDFRRVTLPLPGGSVAGLEFGPAERPLDILFLYANGFNARTYRQLLSHGLDPERSKGQPHLKVASGLEAVQ